jgi:iduronate 2-sulfatase
LDNVYHLTILAWIVIVTALLSQAADARETARRPNVLFIAIDDLRPALGCYGDRVAITPNIDRLASRGSVFSRAYCQQAVCSPSRLSLLTGQRPDTIRVWDLRTHFRDALPAVVTLPQHFKNHGYHTQSIGKIYHGSGEPAQDLPSWSVSPQFDVVRDPKLRYALPNNLQGKGLKRSAAEAADVADNVYIDGIVCEAAMRTLAELKHLYDGLPSPSRRRRTDWEVRPTKGQPFFLAVGFRKPHLPFCAPQKYWDLYDRATIPLPASDSHPQDAPELATRSWQELEGYTDIPKEGNLSEEKVRELRHGYYACVSYVDALVGRLLEELTKLELAENTVVVLWGDHGYHLGEQGLWTKANNYELATRVPLIISVPAGTLYDGLPSPSNSDTAQDFRRTRKSVVPTGTTTKALVELVDVYPTLADICALDAPTGVEGISLKPLLAQPDRPWKEAVFSQFPRAHHGHRHLGHGDIMGYAVRTDRYRYIEWREWKTKRVVARELYDHDSDPDETRNVATQRAGTEAIRELAGLLRSGWQSGIEERSQ